MKKDVLIRLESTQYVEGDNDGATMELAVTGTAEYSDGVSVIEYTEHSDDGKQSHTTLTVTDGNTVSIMRHGEFSSEMTVEKNVKHHSFYSTPYGDLTIGVYGNLVDWKRNGKKSVLRIIYSLDFNNGFVSENHMNIYIEEK